MEDQSSSSRELKKSIKVVNKNARIHLLRKSYLEGTLKVDAARLADKLIAFEKPLSRVLPE